MQLAQLCRALFLFMFALSFSIAAPTSTGSAGNPQSTACGDIVNDPDQNIVFNASLIYECLTSVPFNAAVATSFLQYYNDTLQFQSTLAYLKNPPTSYQQPGIDLVASLGELQVGVNNNAFQNHYEFEAALMALLLASHDSHLVLDSGILAVFSFGTQWDLVSVSADGIEIPKVYLAEDIADNNGDYTPSAIATINDEDVVTYLDRFAAQNNVGGLESHTDWNQLFFSPAEAIQNSANIFTGGSIFYPGDTITFAFENGTSFTDNFLGVYYSQGPTGPLQTGGDFFNFFVLGFYPDSFDPDLIDNNTVNITDTSTSILDITPAASTTTVVSWTSTAIEVLVGGAIASIGGFTSTTTALSTATPTGCPTLNSSFYPACADVAQEGLNHNNNFGVTGYFLRDASIAVLSIPSFDIGSDDDPNDFDAAVAEFISSSQVAGMTKIVIDLQGNEGGEPLLATDIFKRFFPNVKPYGGSRLRATTPVNVMGQTLTSVFQNLTAADDEYSLLVDSEWVSTTKLNANTNQTFATWPEFFGPSKSNGDFFTTVQRYDVNNSDFVRASFDNRSVTFLVYGAGSEEVASTTAPPFAAENIIILSDGICASTCALFVEMMHHEAGVRVVAAGGRPVTGPMQAPAGGRGAVVYDTFNLDGSISTVQGILEDNNSPRASFLPNRSNTGDVFVTFASVNLRDQVRIGETTPLQFAYEAADCRIFYTPQTVFNYTLLWKYAADAIWTNPGLCVANSTGFATAPNAPSNFLTGPNGTVSSPEIITLGDIAASLSLTNASFLDFDTDTTILDFTGYNQPSTPCDTDKDCESTEINESCVSNSDCNYRRCAQVKDTCGNPSKQCLTGCTSPGTFCGQAGAKCTNQLPTFPSTLSAVNSLQNLCMAPIICRPTGSIRQRRVVGSSLASTKQAKSTSGSPRTPQR